MAFMDLRAKSLGTEETVPRSPTFAASSCLLCAGQALSCKSALHGTLGRFGRAPGGGGGRCCSIDLGDKSGATDLPVLPLAAALLADDDDRRTENIFDPLDEFG